MLSLPGRNGRRRRVLNDEVLSASSSHVALRAMADPREASHYAPRYSDAAGVENHPQVTDFVPRRYRTIALLVVTGVLTTAALAALHFFALPIATACGLTHVGALDLSAYGSLATWISAVVLFVTSVACLLVYSIRRHRINDYRGRYRIWLAAAIACVLLSANSVIGLHELLTQSLSHYTGWTALRAGAAWWLVIAGLPLTWIAIRTLLDVRECRVATLLLVSSVGSYLTAGASFLGLSPIADPRMETLITGAATLLAKWFLLAAIVSYSRFVILDAQGLIPVVRIRRTSNPSPPREATGDRTTEQQSPPPTKSKSLFEAAGLSRPKPTIQTVKSPASSTQWVDGSRVHRERYDDDSDEEENDDRKLTKAERKQLRKLKARDRAA